MELRLPLQITNWLPIADHTGHGSQQAWSQRQGRACRWQLYRTAGLVDVSSIAQTPNDGPCGQVAMQEHYQGLKPWRSRVKPP